MSNAINKVSVMISAGGTGGHIFPALAIAKELAQKCQIVWVGATYGLENQIVPKAGFSLECVEFGGLRNKGWRKKLLLPFSLARAVIHCVQILRRHQPQVIVGFGGYATFPICLSGWLMRIPVIIHEQNSIAGLTNRILAKLATQVLTAFPKVLPSNKTSVVGNPVRNEILNLNNTANPAPETAKLRVLIIGGSLGAKALNENVPAALSLIPAKIAAIVHQVGRAQQDVVAAQYAKLGLVAEVREFIEDMAQAYAQADIVICRAGASTVSEIACAAKAAIFIPYPYAVDDHQTANASYLVNNQAALLLPQAQLTPAKLADILATLTPASCYQLGLRALQLAVRDSSSQICTRILHLIN
jgi:UDP-N-acetylglucosamine--N-acetylmuramyl-(pentapeptide) pyrophosphoryl-undecaprenol N-acetylglucosamine transferase